MDELDLESENYSFNKRNKNLVNNQLLSDVCFLVGDEKVKIYGHQQNLALGSPVFYKMFYGDLKMFETEAIPIPDLTADGFLNTIKYIYGHEFNDIKLEEIYDTYLAADKYLVYDLKKKLSNYIKVKLDETNCCIIYDQLIKIQSLGIQDEDILPLNDVKNLIKLKTKSAFNSDHFLNITQDTLIELLKINELNIEEIDLLKSCLKWINKELERNNLDLNLENRKMIFDKFRHLINYSKLSFEQLNLQYKDIIQLFDLSEIGSIYIYLNGNTDKMFNFNKNLRKMLIVCSKPYDQYYETDRFKEFGIGLNVNKRIDIKSIRTACKKDLKEFICFKNGQVLNLNYERQMILERNEFNIKDQLILEPNNNYRFVFKYGNNEGEKFNYLFDYLSKDKELRYKNDGDDVIFNFEFKYFNFNFIERIDFYIVE